MGLSLASAGILLAGVLLSIAGVVVVRRIIPQEKLTENNDYAGFTYSILGLIYGIYLAFTVVVVWQQYEDAEAEVVRESVLLRTLWRNSQALPEESRARIQQNLHAYAVSVVRDEWPAMEASQARSDKTQALWDGLWQHYYDAKLDPANAVQVAFYNESIDRMNEMTVTRNMRLLSSGAELPGIMWMLLIAGAAGTIAFTWFYGTRYLSLQVVVTAFLSTVIIYSVLLVAMLQHPYSGEVRIDKSVYEDVVRAFEKRRTR